ncbi:hypothetical protein D0A38_06195 [Xanthomonas campestris pv. incanae]|nr:hypothetical protein D0A38_06195 [Xanthomonas campestris pv. incanae]
MTPCRNLLSFSGISLERVMSIGLAHYRVGRTLRNLVTGLENRIRSGGWLFRSIPNSKKSAASREVMQAGQIPIEVTRDCSHVASRSRSWHAIRCQWCAWRAQWISPPAGRGS